MDQGFGEIPGQNLTVEEQDRLFEDLGRLDQVVPSEVPELMEPLGPELMVPLGEELMDLPGQDLMDPPGLGFMELSQGNCKCQFRNIFILIP